MAGVGTESMMYATMMGQPDDVQALLTSGWSEAERAASALSKASRIIVTGIGTSFHAALVGSWLLRAAGTASRAVSSFDLATYPDSIPLHGTDAVIVMAHTGVKSYSALALERAVASGATVISVGSQSADHPGSSQILRTVPREQSAAYTSSHLCAMTVLAQIATVLGEGRNQRGTALFREELTALPGQIDAVLKRLDEVQSAAAYGVDHQIYATGAGPNEATALELVIKAREAAYGRVDGLAAEQFLHGPMVAVNAGDMAVVVQVAGHAAARVAEIAQVLDGFGARLWLVGQEIDGNPDAEIFTLPAITELLSPLLAVVPMQMLAYAMATRKSLDPDTFRRQDPIYKNAFGRLTL